MEYKSVSISNSVSIPVPKGLTPEAEALFIAERIGFVDFDALEAQCKQAMKDTEAGKLVDLHTVLDDLKSEMESQNGQHA